MKQRRKISAREWWVLAFVPAVLILGLYLYVIYDSLTAGLEKERHRLEASSSPAVQAQAASPLEKARAARESAKRDVADRQEQIAQLDARLAALIKIGADRHASASVIERVEAIFARDNITPVTSEQADDGDAAQNAPATILDVLAPKLPNEQAGMRREGRVWHLIFDDKTPSFQRALKQLSQDNSIVTLSMNLVYNPANLGQTRLLELWLLY